MRQIPSTSAEAGQDTPPEAVPAPFSNSAARAVAVVEFLASNSNQTFTLSEIARRCALRKSTAKVVLSCLHEAGWLTRSPMNLQYGLGPALIMIGRAADESRPEVNLARPVMLELSLELHCECILSATTGDEILVLESTGPGGLRGRSFAAGQRGPFVAPYGAVFVAWRSAEGRREWYEQSPSDDPDWVRELDQILDECVRRGYVVAVQSDPRERMMQVLEAVSGKLSIKEIRDTLRKQLSQLPPGAFLLAQFESKDRYVVNSLQAPIFDRHPGPAYALGVTFGRELDGATIAKFGKRVRSAADLIAEAIASHAPGSRPFG